MRFRNHQENFQNHVAQEELKPFWMQFKKDKAKAELQTLPLLFLTFAAESSADFQSAVSQDCILQAAQTYRPTQVSSDAVQN